MHLARRARGELPGFTPTPGGPFAPAGDADDDLAPRMDSTGGNDVIRYPAAPVVRPWRGLTPEPRIGRPSMPAQPKPIDTPAMPSSPAEAVTPGAGEAVTEADEFMPAADTVSSKDGPAESELEALEEDVPQPPPAMRAAPREAGRTQPAHKGVQPLNGDLAPQPTLDMAAANAANTPPSPEGSRSMRRREIPREISSVNPSYPRRARAPDDAPVRVTIGRIEVRAPAAQPPPPASHLADPALHPKLSLAEYLQRRHGTGRP